jgi:hypothetical protein
MGSRKFYLHQGHPAHHSHHYRRAQSATMSALMRGVAAVVIGVVGFATALLAALPGAGFVAVLMRATVLCATGGGLYLALAWLFGIREFERFERMLLRRVRWRRRAAPAAV